MQNNLTQERIERAMDYLERCKDGLDAEFDASVDVAIAALRECRERLNPASLTLDELRGDQRWLGMDRG